jgi:hypothetical protein
MKLHRWAFLTGFAAMLAGLGGQANAGIIPFTYTASTSGSLTYQYFGNASGSVTPGGLSGSGTIASAPSTAGASNAVGDFPFTYSGGTVAQGDFYVVSGTIDLTIHVTIAGVGGGTGTFVIQETYANLVTSGGIPPAPALTGVGGSETIGIYDVTLNAISEGANIHVPGGTSINAGFEYTMLAVPEPCSLALTGVGGLCAVVLANRRRRRTA